MTEQRDLGDIRSRDDDMAQDLREATDFLAMDPAVAAYCDRFFERISSCSLCPYRERCGDLDIGELRLVPKFREEWPELVRLANIDAPRPLDLQQMETEEDQRRQELMNLAHELRQSRRRKDLFRQHGLMEQARQRARA